MVPRPLTPGKGRAIVCLIRNAAHKYIGDPLEAGPFRDIVEDDAAARWTRNPHAWIA